MVLANLAGPLTFIAAVILMYLLVPKERIKDFFMLGLIGGLVVALVLVYLMQNLLGLWVFHRVDYLSIARIPIFLSMTWIPIVIIFSQLLSQSREITSIGSILLAIPLIAVLTHYLLILNGMLIYRNWNLLLTFLLSLAIHLGITFYLYLSGRLKLSQASS